MNVLNTPLLFTYLNNIFSCSDGFWDFCSFLTTILNPLGGRKSSEENRLLHANKQMRAKSLVTTVEKQSIFLLYCAFSLCSKIKFFYYWLLYKYSMKLLQRRFNALGSCFNNKQNKNKEKSAIANIKYWQKLGSWTLHPPTHSQ